MRLRIGGVNGADAERAHKHKRHEAECDTGHVRDGAADTEIHAAGGEH